MRLALLTTESPQKKSLSPQLKKVDSPLIRSNPLKDSDENITPPSSPSSDDNNHDSTDSFSDNEKLDNSIKRRFSLEQSVEKPLSIIKATLTTKAKTFTDIFPEELNAIAKRRAIVLGKFPTFTPGKTNGVPSTTHNLFGLALSGGGIRSATFNLGVLQALSKHKLLKHIDILSTVSGGGFIGSSLVSLLGVDDDRFSTDWEKFPFKYGSGTKEDLPLRHLRNSANYLASGLFEFLLFPVLVLRGIVLNLLSIFPFIWMLLLFERYFAPFHFGSCVAENSHPDQVKYSDCYLFSVRVGWNLFFHIILYPLLIRPKVSVPVLLAFFMCYFKDILSSFSQIHNSEIIITVLLHLYLNYPTFLKWEGSKVWYDRSFGWLFLILIASTFIESLPIIEYYYHWFFGSTSGTTSFRMYPLMMLIVLILADSFAFTLLTDPKLSPIKRLVFHIVVIMIGPLLLIFMYLELSMYMDSTTHILSLGNAVCCVISLLSLFTLDINETSMHKYYRDRLSNAYMFRMRRNGTLASTGGEKISSINRSNKAPYLLINTTINSNVEDDKMVGMATKNRCFDFFIFSKLFVGSESSGFRSTSQMEKLDRRLDLATAISISGAAVAPKMGTATIPSLVLSLGILNIRLGYWIPNPLGVFLAHPKMGRLFYGGFACFHLLKEFGWPATTSKDWCVNLSDGGHIENLGAYELMRRRCKFIIICDAEADPDMSFPSLAQLMRLVRIDFGITIHINLDDIRPKGPFGYSKKHWTVGKIIYQKNAPKTEGKESSDSPPGEVGYLLYIKSSLTGDEDEVIKEYRSRHTTFPHESTTDQFFSEAQFESYRSLGYHIAGSGLFGPKYARNFDGENIEQFFEKLYQSCKELKQLPHGWQEHRDTATGEQYFVNSEHQTKTWADPRHKSSFRDYDSE